MRWVIAGGVLVACGARAPGPARPASDPAARLAIAIAEADRAAGIARLTDAAAHGDAAVRRAALRGLGRVGGHDAIVALIAALTDPEPAIATAAAAALGLAAATDSVPAADADPVAEALVAARGRGGLDAAIVVEALGRAGDDRARGALIEAVADPDPRVASAAAIALGRFGRRGLPLGQAERAALIDASTRAAREVRYAATYALARAVVAPADAALPADLAVIGALGARLADDDGETRAIAAAGAARQGGVAALERALIDRLADHDWRVRVEVVRALAGDHGTAAGRDAVAVHAVRTWAALGAGRAAPGEAHELLEALRLLAGHADQPTVAQALIAIAPAAPAPIVGPHALELAWADCLATDALARPRPAPGPIAPEVAFARLDHCGAGLAAWQRQVLIAEAVGAGAGGDPAARAARLIALLAGPDPRTTGAALGALPAIIGALEPAAQAATAATIAQQLHHADAAVVEAAAEAAAALIADAQLADPTRAPVRDALLARAAEPEANPEVRTELLGAIATAKLGAGLATCTVAAADANPAIRAAGRACITALGGALPAEAAALAPAHPPVDPATVLGHDVHWTVDTSRGRVVIALAAEIAPWHVAALVALTRAHFYDGLLWHRVVPDFVAQGGDPTGTGAGGPGYTIPAEVSASLDAPGYATGAVGIADSGKDTGGSQWFVMHGPAPHLAGRYTQVGQVVAGQDVIDALQVGDTITTATVEIK